MTWSVYFQPDNWISEMFEENYPFDVWEDKLEQLSKGGAIHIRVYQIAETLLSLVDAYVTVLTGSLRNPAFRWISIEQFSPPKRIGEVVRFLRDSDGWERIQSSSEYVSVEATVDEGEPLPDEQLYSTLLGNPAVRLKNGKLRTTYEPEALLDTVKAVTRFRDESRGVHNAFKHGYRLPAFSDCGLETLIGQSAVGLDGTVIGAEKVRASIYSSSLVPSFWFLESDPNNQNQQDCFEGATAELRLYGVSPAVGLAYCRLVLELLKLLFDSSRNASCLGEALARMNEVDFQRAMQPLLQMWLPIQQPPEGEPYIVSAYVPRE